jgi:hypothetical protein
MAKRLTRHDLLEWLDTIWAQYPRRLQELPDVERARFAQQQGYARSQDLQAHLGAWMEETLRVMPYLRRDEKPPYDYQGDDEFNARAVRRLADHSWAAVEAWYEQQRLALRHLVEQLADEDFAQQRVSRWLVGTIVGHYDDHPLPTEGADEP